jgi:hypothetical protein
MNEEDEAFNEIEKRSKVKQDILMHPSKEAMLTAEVAVLTEMVRAQAKRVAEMETLVLIEREACAKVCQKHAEVYASLPNTLTTDASWAACIDIRDEIRARGES